ALVESAHDWSDGGRAVTLADAAFPTGVGMTVELASQGLPAEFALFGEYASRVVLSCDPSNLSRIKKVAVQYGVSLDMIGVTIPEQVEIKLDGQLVVSSTVSELRDVYENALERALRTEADALVS
ncbi:MAG: phosphoribosylformylglycinamidine synthase II, partial [Acidobacteria bacterium]